VVTEKTRLIVFSNPNNPLGITWPDNTVKELAEFARERNLLVVVDEIYRDFTTPRPPLSIASLPGMKQRTFTLQGFSKRYFMMGMRIGYLAGPEEAVFHIKQLHYLIMLSPSRIAQYAALAALDCPSEFVEEMHREYREKLRILYEGIIGIPGASCVEPNGSFYAFPNFSCFGLTSMDLAVKLIEEAGLMSLPGTEFGPTGEGYLRLSVVSDRDRVEDGVERLQRFAQRRSKHRGR
jgi:aminotransferase